MMTVGESGMDSGRGRQHGNDAATAVEGGTRRKARRGIHAGDGWTAHVLLTPWFLGFFGLTLVPVLVSLYLSFTDYDLLSAPHWVNVQNYVEMFTTDPRYLNALRVTMIYVFVSVPLSVAMALVVAVMLNRGLSGMAFYRSIYYLPSLLGSSVAIAVLWRQIFDTNGLVNRVLDLVGIHGPSWISTPAYALYTLVVLHVWQFGAPMVIFLAGLRQIPRDLLEAAAVDGAGPVKSFLKVTIPMLTPLIFFNLVLAMIGAFKSFTQAFIISGGKGGPVDSTMFYTLYLYIQAFTNFRMGYASAMAWVLVLIIGIFTALAFRTGRYWVHYDD